jgi:hypothetical protein
MSASSTSKSQPRGRREQGREQRYTARKQRRANLHDARRRWPREHRRWRSPRTGTRERSPPPSEEANCSVDRVTHTSTLGFVDSVAEVSDRQDRADRRMYALALITATEERCTCTCPCGCPQRAPRPVEVPREGTQTFPRRAKTLRSTAPRRAQGAQPAGSSMPT